MKVKSEQAAPAFTPINLTITIESEQEKVALFCLFNHTALDGWMNNNGINTENVRDAIGTPNKYSEVLNSLTQGIRKWCE